MIDNKPLGAFRKLLPCFFASAHERKTNRPQSEWRQENSASTWQLPCLNFYSTNRRVRDTHIPSDNETYNLRSLGQPRMIRQRFRHAAAK